MNLRNRIAATDDLETLTRKLTEQANAKERDRRTTDARRLRVLAAVSKMAQRLEQRLEEKFGPMRMDRGRVVRVADGDTLFVRRPDGETIRIRLYGIDAPELGQPFGPVARNFLDRWKYRRVEWEPVRADRWSRIVAIVWGPEQGPSVNARLLEAGLAWVSSDFCGREICRRWKRIQEIAMEERRGLWAQESPEAPWHYRGSVDDD